MKKITFLVQVVGRLFGIQAFQWLCLFLLLSSCFLQSVVSWGKHSGGRTPAAEETPLASSSNGMSSSAASSNNAGPPVSTSNDSSSFVSSSGVSSSGGPGAAPISGGGGDDNKIGQSEEPELGSSPFSEFGQYNGQAEEEDADTFYFQNGRFFGISLGFGFQVVDQNRGALWEGGFPTLDLRLHYWFDFNFALNIYVYTAYHFYDTNVLSLGHVDVSWASVGVHFKYYFDTRNLSAPISFASPYVLFGLGTYYKVETSNAAVSQDTENSIGLSGGLGIEFPISPRKTYFQLEARMNAVTFSDTYSTEYLPNLPNLTGFFYTVTGSILLTW